MTPNVANVAAPRKAPGFRPPPAVASEGSLEALLPENLLVSFQPTHQSSPQELLQARPLLSAAAALLQLLYPLWKKNDAKINIKIKMKYET